MAKENEKIVVDLQDLLFDVKLNDNPRTTNSEYSKVVTGIIDGEEIDLNYCSPRYELVPNASIFPEIENILNAAKINFNVTYEQIANVRFYADYHLTDNRFAYTMNGTADSIYPMIRVRHSYNGMTKYAITFGYFRLVCSNGLVIPVEEMNEYNLHITGKHTTSILGSIDQLKIRLKRFVKNDGNVVTRILNKYELLGGSWVANPEKRVEEVLKANGINIVDNSKRNTIHDILNRVFSESIKVGLGYKGRVNDWLLYNGINAYLNDDTLNISAPEKRAEKDSKVFEYMLKSVA